MAGTSERRQAATEHYAAGMAAINTVLDRADEIHTLLHHLQDAAAAQDVVAAARAVIDMTTPLAAGLHRLLDAAQHATTYRAKTDLANDIGTRTRLLFPRVSRPTANQPDAPADTGDPRDSRHLDSSPERLP